MGLIERTGRLSAGPGSKGDGTMRLDRASRPANDSTRRVLAWLIAGVIAAGCSSGPGPLSQPQIDQRLLIEASLAEVSPRLEGSGTIFVRDAVDPEVVERMRQDQGFADSLTDAGPLTGGLSAGTKDAIRASLGKDRPVEFVSGRDVVPRGGEDVLGCTPIADDGLYLAFAPTPALAVHGGVFFVTFEVSSGCTTRTFAVRLLWVEGQPIGGYWDATEVLEGPAVAV